jgi:hypothetical protein
LIPFDLLTSYSLLRSHKFKNLHAVPFKSMSEFNLGPLKAKSPPPLIAEMKADQQLAASHPHDLAIGSAFDPTQGSLTTNKKSPQLHVQPQWSELF